MVMLQVPGDGVRAGVQALPGQVLAQPHDQVGGLAADGPGGGFRPPGPRFECRLAFGLIPGEQSVDPGPGHPVTAGNLAGRAVLDSDSSDDQPGFRHPGSVIAARPLARLPRR